MINWFLLILIFEGLNLCGIPYLALDIVFGETNRDNMCHFLRKKLFQLIRENLSQAQALRRR